MNMCCNVIAVLDVGFLISTGKEIRVNHWRIIAVFTVSALDLHQAPWSLLVYNPNTHLHALLLPAQLNIISIHPCVQNFQKPVNVYVAEIQNLTCFLLLFFLFVSWYSSFG